MTFTHEDANARLLDLVYGEAAPAERTALEAHVAGCARCQSDLHALGDTRARVRVAMDDEAPPARAHARILAAAAEAANGAGAGAATAPPAKGNEPASRAARLEERPSLWDRLRSKWTFPTLATVGAVAVIVIGAKFLLNPQANLERGKQGLFPQDEAASTAAANAAAEREALQKSAAAPVAAAAPPAASAEPLPPREAPRELSPQARARIEAVRRYGHPRTSVSDLMGERPAFQSDKLGGAPAGQALKGLRPDDFGANAKGSVGAGRGAALGGAAAPAAPQEKKPAKGSMDDLLEGSLSGSDRYASPPPPRKSAARPSTHEAASPPPIVSKKKTINDDPLEGYFNEGGGGAPRSAPAAPAAAPSPRPAPPPARQAPREERAAAPEMQEADEAEAPAPKSRAASASRSKADAPAADAKKEKDAPAPWEAPAKHADELYAAQRWSEASAAYNDLLRRFPAAPLAFAWRSRLTIAQREAAPKTAPAAKAAKKPTAPAAASPASE
jgi:hypothetical protein